MKYIIIIFACKNILHVWKLLYKNSILKWITVLDIQCLNKECGIALTNVCSAIYTKWLNRKSNNYLLRS